MPRKKLSEMTPYERVEQRMKGMSWEEAEDVAVEILARCTGLHVHVRKDSEEWIPKLFERIGKRADEWSQEHSFKLALTNAVLKSQQQNRNHERV